MSTSTDGIICYGSVFEEGYEFPWDGEWDGDLEEWWRDVNEYKPPFELFDKNGNYIDGKEPPKSLFKEYYDHRHDWLENNPVPVELVNYCSGDYPMYILACPSSVKRANRGSPQEINDNDLLFIDEKYKALVEFMDKYNLESENANKWWLCSCWD